MLDLTKPKITGISDLVVDEPGNILLAGSHGFHIATQAVLADATSLTDEWPQVRDIANTPDRAAIRGRFTHGGEPANRNGHLFRTDHLVTASLAIVHAPLNMLHRTQHVLGTFAAARMVFPNGAQDLDVSQQFGGYSEVETVAAFWKWAFPDEFAAVQKAHDMGLAFLSQEGIPASVTCPTCDHTAPWDGYVNPGNCEHMNQPRAARWMNDPLFLGGACVVPPARPGWKDAFLTKVGDHLSDDTDRAHELYKAVAATAPHLSPAEVEGVMAMLTDHAQPDLDPGAVRRVIAPMWESFEKRYPEVDFIPPLELAEAVDLALVDPPEAAVDVLHRARNLAARSPQPPATVRRLADDLTLWRPTAPDLYELWGGAIGLEWASSVVDQMDDADAKAVAEPQHTSAVLVLRPSPEVAQAISDAGDQPVDQVHVTMVFFRRVDGDKLAATEVTKDQMVALIGAAVAGTEPMTATLSGIGVFHQPKVDVTYVSIDCPGLAQLYTRLVEAFDLVGVPYAKDHGFTAHSTIAETEHGAGPTEVPVGQSWTVDSVELWWGNDRGTPITFGAQANP